MKKNNTNILTVEWFISHFRWGWLFITTIILFLNPPPDENLTMFYGLIGAGFIYNLVAVVLLSLKWYPKSVGYTLAVFDLILSIAIMWLAGGHNSFMLPTLLFPVITSVLYINPESGLLLSALPITLVYIASVLIKGDVNLVKIVADLGTLYGAGLIAGYVSQKQLLAQTQRRATEIQALKVENDRANVIYEMANTLSSTLNYQQVLSAMIELAQLALSEASGGAAQDKSTIGMVLLFDQDGPLGQLTLMTGRNISKREEGKRIPLKEGGLLTQIIYKAEAVIRNDIQNNAELQELSANLKNYHSLICAPLRAGFDMYGLVLFASPQKDAYTEEHMSLLTTFCNQAIIALQNAELYADLERKQQKILEQEAQARHELARNLHDGPTQAVAAIAMRLNFVSQLLQREGNIKKSIEEIGKIEEIAQRATKEIRTMLFTLRPIVLETQGLVAAIEQYADRLRDLHSLNIKLDLSGYKRQLNTQEEGIIFAIIEEAVGNAKKYSQAENITIRLATQSGYAIAQIADNGKGFDVKAVKSTYDQRGSLGLLNMEERAQMVGGQCSINSAPGKGTTVKVEVPID